MPINLKITFGTVNFTDYIHVTASKVSAPSTVVWETWIDVPVSSYNFIIPGLDADNYYVRYYDAPTNSALGTLKMELLVSAVTGETISEKKYYKCGGSNPGDPTAGTTFLIDPYLINKNVVGVFKEYFRFLDPLDEWSFDDSTGNVSVLTGVQFSTDERFVVEIEYKGASDAAPPMQGGLYVGTKIITDSTYTLSPSDIDKRIILLGAVATQSITVCSLASIAVDRGFYFDNAFGGAAVQVKILFPSSDRLRFNGMMAASFEYVEFWIDKGHHLLIRKYNDSWWNAITDYNGVRVGERMASGFKGQPLWLPEDGTLYDGDEYGRLWWYINNQLPSTHVITDNNVVNIGYAHPANRLGQFVKHSTLKKFRVPNTQNLSERGLKDFISYGSDTANRPYDYPGGFQDEMVGPHTHPDTPLQTPDVDRGGSGSLFSIDNKVDGKPNTGTEQRVKNIGVIYSRHI